MMHRLSYIHIYLIFFFKSYRHHQDLHSFPTRRSSDLIRATIEGSQIPSAVATSGKRSWIQLTTRRDPSAATTDSMGRSEEHTSELQSHHDLVCRLLLEKKKKQLENAAQLTTSDTAESI